LAIRAAAEAIYPVILANPPVGLRRIVSCRRVRRFELQTAGNSEACSLFTFFSHTAVHCALTN